MFFFPSLFVSERENIFIVFNNEEDLNVKSSGPCFFLITLEIFQSQIKLEILELNSTMAIPVKASRQQDWHHTVVWFCWGFGSSVVSCPNQNKQLNAWINLRSFENEGADVIEGRRYHVAWHRIHLMLMFYCSFILIFGWAIQVK